MPILPWDDVFYNLSQERADIGRTYNRYIAQRATLNLEGLAYSKQFDDYRNMAAGNYTLMIVHEQSRQSDVEWEQWLKDNQVFTMPVHGEDLRYGLPRDALEIGAVLGTSLLFARGVKALWNWGRSGMRNYLERASSNASDAAEGLAESSEVELVELASGESALEAMADAGLTEAGFEASQALEKELMTAGQGINNLSMRSTRSFAVAGAVFLLLGLDMIVGAMEGKKEKEQLDKDLHLIQGCLDRVDDFLARLRENQRGLNDETLKQMRFFRGNLAALGRIHAPRAKVDLPVGLEHRQAYVHWIHQSATQYGYLARIRKDFYRFRDNAKELGMHLTWDLFQSNALLDKPPHASKAEVQAYFDYAVAHSTDLAALKAGAAID